LNQNVSLSSSILSTIESIYLFIDLKKKEETLLQIRNARQRVRSEIDDLSERIRVTQENIQRLRKRSIENSGTMTSSTQEMEE
jgi:peptidoglycan hydrolase CwlO-like protein